MDRRDARGHRRPVKVKPSPPVCVTCLRPHVRIPASVRYIRRRQLAQYLALVGGEIGVYAIGLFDHLTLGNKVGGVVPKTWADKQAHPYPVLPDSLTAFQLYMIDRQVVLAAFGQL